MTLSNNAAPDQPRQTRVLRASDRRSLSRSATRALDVLEYFGLMRRPLRAIEIARKLSLHPSTANQLLKTMVESAHLAFDATTKTYLPSPRLARFSGWMVETYGSDERLRGLVAQVHAATGEVVTLTTPNDLFMQVIDLAGVDLAGADFTHASLDSAERGLRVSIFGSVIGTAYLATLPVSEVQRLADRARIPQPEHASLLAGLARVRTKGFADGPSGEGNVWSIAAALPESCSSLPLVLGLAGLEDRIRPNLQELSRVLRSGASGLART